MAPGAAGAAAGAAEDGPAGKKRLPRQAQAARDQELTIGIAPSVGTLPTDEELTAFAGRLSEAAMTGDRIAFSGMFDWDALVASITKGVDDPSGLAAAFLRGVRQPLTINGGLVDQVVGQAGAGGTYTFLRLAERAGHPVVRMQLRTPDGGLNYHDLFVNRRSNGDVRAVDFYVFVSGETVGESVRRGYLLTVKEQSQGLLSRLMGSDRLLNEHGHEFALMASANRDGRYADVLTICKAMPEGMRRMKATLIARITAAGALGDNQELMAALNTFEEAYPGDAALDLLSIDAMLLRGRYNEALAAVDRLDRAVGGDPYLDTLRANIFGQQGNQEKAREAADRLVENMPDDLNSYFTQIGLALVARDFEAVARWLDVMQERIEVDFDDFSQIPEYAEFVASDPGKAWIKHHEEQKATSPPEGPGVPMP